MADHTQSDDSGLPNQSAYPGFNWNACGEELSLRDDVRYLLSDKAVVQVEDRPNGFDANFTDIFMVGRVRAVNDARVPRIQLLQFHCDCILRSSYLRNRCYAHL